MWTAGMATLLATLLAWHTTRTGVAAHQRPNIVFIMTDDQDYEMQSLQYMPRLQKHILDAGTLYDRHYCTISICCPSRVSLWTGKAAHNTNVTDVVPPYGGYPKFVRQGLNDNFLPVWLQQSGYNTYYTGKLFNAHTVTNYNRPLVNGFNGSDFLLDPYTYVYYNASMTRNGAPPVQYEGLYSPDVVADKAYGFLDDAASHERPFFLGVAPIAPHSNTLWNPRVAFDIPQYAERHAHLFKDYKIPRTANHNPDVPSGVGWVKDLPKLNDTMIDYYDEFQRARLRALQAVDEMVEQIVLKLESKGILDNTYIFYTTDNGFHIAQHRMPPGKTCAFETDIHIPLAIRGPGVPAGRIAGTVSSHTDLTPTILKIAGISRPDLDGSPIPLNEVDFATATYGEHVNVEFWGRAILEGKYGSLGPVTAKNNTYKALRVIGERYSFLYTVWCTGEKEYYDLYQDHDQMRNYLGDDQTHLANDYTIAGRSFRQILSRIDSLLMVLKSCKADSCRQPWSALHPDGKVKTLEDALDSDYDAFYEEQPKVSFSSCQPGYILGEEGPQGFDVWEDGSVYRSDGSQQPLNDRGHWSWWT